MAGKKLLVADDSLTIQKVIRLALSNEGYEIQAISDGADALQQISVFRPDLILIDVSLPTRTAFEIKRELNTMEEFENTRFILMSSAFEKIDETQAKEIQFHGRLTKPFDPAHLRQVLQEVLNAAPASPKKGATKSSPAIQPGPPPSSFPAEKTQPGIRREPHFFDPGNAPEPTIQVNLDDMEDLTPLPLPQAKAPEGFSHSFKTKEETESAEKTDQSSTQKDEIKHLTESTIRMSGLDDFDWTVNDANLKPPASMDDGGTGFRMKPQFSQEPAAPQGMPPISQTRPTPSSSNTGAFSRSHTPPPLPGVSPGISSSISSEQLEEVIKRQVQETLTEMAQKILPEVAERVIKAEIHRLLNEKI